MGPLLPIKPQAVNRGLEAHGRDAVARLEIEELRAVDDAHDHLAHVVGLAVVDRHHPGDLLRVVERLRELGRRRSLVSLVPVETGDQIAGDSNAVPIVLGQILDQTRHGRVHFRAA